MPFVPIMPCQHSHRSSIVDVGVIVPSLLCCAADALNNAGVATVAFPEQTLRGTERWHFNRPILAARARRHRLAELFSRY